MIALLANGEDPTTAPELQALAACRGVVCCDRAPCAGAPKLLQIIGDMDTYHGTESCVTNLHEDQETNDLTKARRWIAANAPGEEIAYFAVTGKREDHTLANLALIAEAGERARIYTASGVFDCVPACTALRLPVRADAPLSLLSFVPQRVTARGLQWPVEDLMLDSLWRATLNRTTASTLILSAQAPILIYQPHEGSHV